jgi:hypothetical protein
MSAVSPRVTRPRALPTIGGVLVSAGLVVTLSAMGTASAATPTTINLGTAAAASVIAGSAVTNIGASVLGADLDTAPATASSITGFPPGTILGTEHADDGVAQVAQSDLTTAYNAAASAPSTANETGVDLGGKTLTEGVYTASSSMQLTGALTLNGSASSVFIFQAGTTLTTGSASSVILTGGVQACNVFWQVGSSATLGTTTSFQGNILALTSISVGTGSTVVGRALARNGAVTLDDDTFTAPACTTATPPTTTVTTTPVTTAPVTTAPVTTPPASNAPTSPVAATPATPAAPTPTPSATKAVTPTAVPNAVTPKPITPTATHAAATTPAAENTTAIGGGGGATLLTGTPGTALASTGMNARPILETGGATILVGATLLLVSRRRRALP